MNRLIFKVIFIIANLGLVLFATASASAADEAAKACSADVQKFCPKVKPGEGRIGRCLVQHRQELSPDCQQYLTQAVKTEVEKFRAACDNDIAQHCSGVKAGQRRILKCLNEHRDSLSSACQQMLKPH